ncbi:hypothetical protein [Ideonella livida]|uniref:Uncharacterized protein n=1 Tax=Ideonella livida TaxID=2707176 RepID=A0A7C9PEK0_9BURK|nr:hypothetical protein [Ideonella livida]NDY89916.1 hypothetical protein [Ideonella livida]
MHKTGSSAIQSYLFEHPPTDPTRWTYLHFGHANSSGSVQKLHSRQATRKIARAGGHPARLAAAQARLQAQLEQALAQAPADTLILSAEGLTHLQEPELDALVQTLRRHVDVVQAVGYLRPVASHMDSAQQQLIRGGGHRFVPSASFPRYRTQLEKFERVLGRDQVQYWPYEPSTFPDGCVVQDFLQRLGLTPLPGAQPRVNERLSADALSLLYVLQHAALVPAKQKDTRAIRDRLIQQLIRLQGPRMTLDPVLVAGLMAQHRDEIEWAQARVAIPLDTPQAASAGLRQVATEADLLRPGPEAVRWLSAQLGTPLAEDAPLPVLEGALFQLWRRLEAEASGQPAPALLSGVELARAVRRAQREAKRTKRRQIQRRREALQAKDQTPPASAPGAAAA